MPKGYWICFYRSISNPAALAEYARLAGPAIQSGGLECCAANRAGASARNRDRVGAGIAIVAASAQFRFGSAGGPPTVLACFSIDKESPVTDAEANPKQRGPGLRRKRIV